jgi:hypothetical protein
VWPLLDSRRSFRSQSNRNISPQPLQLGTINQSKGERLAVLHENLHQGLGMRCRWYLMLEHTDPRYWYGLTAILRLKAHCLRRYDQCTLILFVDDLRVRYHRSIGQSRHGERLEEQLCRKWDYVIPYIHICIYPYIFMEQVQRRTDERTKHKIKQHVEKVSLQSSFEHSHPPNRWKPT